ncbi:MAG TPA: DUF2203 domain-containing protein [Dehalococcoidia bacterium]|jgi:hypothetical protein|nr:DUF2203 domain-containing protein [Dehalococcoidia bacterium]
MAPRRFTLQEAEILLPRLSGLLAEIQARKADYETFRRRVEALGLQMKGNGHMVTDLKEAQAGLERSAEEVNRLAKELPDTGGELKDLDQGLVDFRTEMDGREVYLCWKLGETSIGWWHELDTSFGGRQPLPPQAAGQ